MPEFDDIRAVVTDIEGTTSALTFVHDVLFPYARQHLPEFVRNHADQPAVRELLDDVQPGADVETVIETLIRWIDEDRKATPLKSLQGMIWKQGFERAAFKGHVYPDAAAALERWRSAGQRLFVYSSGSVQAQQLLFGHSDAGDLSRLFEGYFDTTTGPKRETESYAAIVETINQPANRILFLSDIVEELDAAGRAGMATCWLIRDGQIPPQAGHAVARSFDDIELSGPGGGSSGQAVSR